MSDHHEAKRVTRLNTTLPEPLALYVGEMTGKGALYETPSEFIRDLLRRHMEKHQAQQQERTEIEALLARSLSEDDVEPWTDDDLADARKAAS